MPREFDLEKVKDKLGIGADKVYGVMGEFEDPEDLVEAGRKIRQMGYTKIDAMSPFPVHGIDDEPGLQPGECSQMLCARAGEVAADLKQGRIGNHGWPKGLE